MTATSTTQPVYGQSFGEETARNYEQGFVPAIGAPFGAALVAAAARSPAPSFAPSPRQTTDRTPAVSCSLLSYVPP